MLEPTHNLSLEEMDKERLFHPVTSIADHLNKGPMIVQGASGVRVRDSKGREFIDGGAGLWCVNVGYGRKEIADAAAKTMADLSYFHLFAGSSNEPVIRLADKVLRLLHDTAGATHLSKVFFGLSGSDANDTNYKLVRYYNNLRGRPNKKKVISRIGAYHGLTHASAGLTGIDKYHKAFDIPLPGIFHVGCPHYYRFSKDGESEAQFTDRMIREIEDLIAREGADTVAAFIAEPIMGTGGVFMPPAGYFEKLQKVLDKNDILLIVDEVITGFGRTGHWFGTGLYGLKPDFLTLAKGITSAYAPLSASVLSDRVWDVLKNESPTTGPVMHGFTYTGHPVSASVGLANLAIMERENLPENAAKVGPYFLQRLKEATADNPYVGDVRGVGLILAVEYVADRKTRRAFDPKAGAHRLVSAKCVEEGVLSRALPFIDVMAFSPPLTITKSEIDEAVTRFARGLAKATPELERLAG